MNSVIARQLYAAKQGPSIGVLLLGWLRSTKGLFDWLFGQILSSRPFSYFIRTENNMTVARENKIIKKTAHALKYGKKYSSAEEAHRDVLGDDYYKDVEAC